VNERSFPDALQRLVSLHRQLRPFDLAEAIMNRKGGSNFTTYSAGSHPTGTVRPEAINQIEKAGPSAANARSKSWDEFSTAEAPPSQLCFYGVRQPRKKCARFGLASR
jgi:hypothetical protein